MLRKGFEIACKKHGLNVNYSVSGRTDLFKPSPRAGDQMNLFG
jgi:hypothetical protein